ncbi:hypothetical protein Misp01_37530 [Microtetraspora sp. NBRC 13810]|nr:hypothetical protein Misp01_37530 [Microtetraspora sp. NBRC 13810]
MGERAAEVDEKAVAIQVEPSRRNQEWILTLLPAFPLGLLILRLWYASRQDTQTLLLLAQHVSPLGMLSVVLLTTMWALPAVVLVGRLLGPLYRLSTLRHSWLVRSADRVPDWVVAIAVVLGTLGWQLRFLPTLVMLTLAVVGLTVRERQPDRAALIRFFCLVLPVAVAVLAYVVVWPAIRQAAATGDTATLVLFAAPPGLAPFLTGPVPPVFARPITEGLAWLLLALLPLVAGVVVLRAPILPMIAVEVAAEPGGDRPAEVVVGNLITGDEQMATMLDRAGAVRFIRNDQMISRVLCPDPGAVPRSGVHLHHWYVEWSMLSWLAPHPLPPQEDPRCAGRPAG